MGSPKDAVLSFDEAIANNDEAAAKALSVRWDAEGDTPGKLFRQATRKGFRLMLLADVKQPDRAIVSVGLLLKVTPPGRRGERIWLLTERHGDDWKIAAITQSSPVAALFLDGILKAGQRVRDLPESPTAAAYVAMLLDPGAPPSREADEIRKECPPNAVIVSSHHVAGTTRHVVELGGGDRPGPWVLLNEVEGGFSLQGASQFRAMDVLLEGVPLEYVEDRSEGLRMADDKTGKGSESAEAKAALAKVFQEALSQLGADATKNGGKGSEALLGLFQAALVETKKSADADISAMETAETAAKDADDIESGADPAVVDLDAERKKRGVQPPSEFEQKVQDSVRGAFNAYVVENVAKDSAPGSEIAVDAEFLKDHGPALFASVLQAFARSLIPEEIKVELPTKPANTPANAEAPAADPSQPAAEGDKPSVVPDPPGVKLKVDFNGLINGLLASATKPKPKP